MSAEKNNKKRLYIIIAVVAVLAIGIGAFWYVNKHNEDLAVSKADIQTQISELRQLENDSYFPTDYRSQIDDIEKQAEQASSDNNLESLNSLISQSKSLNSTIKATIDSYQQNFNLLKDAVAKTDELEKEFFASQYDLRTVDQDKEKAQKALDSMDFEQYESLLEALDKENNNLKEFIDEKNAAIVSRATNIDKDYPFAVNIENIENSNCSYIPMKKQSSAEPTDVFFMSSKTTDSLPLSNVNYGDRQLHFDYSPHNVPTKEIKVQMPDGSFKSALVNTELIYNPRYGAEADFNMVINPPYFFKDEDGALLLAVHSFEQNDYYILFAELNSGKTWQNNS